MAGSAVGPTLLTTRELEAEIGVLLRDEVVDRATGVPIGKARRGTSWDLDRLQHHGIWTMKFLDDPPRPLRIMSLAWLLYAWRMQRAVDDQE